MRRFDLFGFVAKVGMIVAMIALPAYFMGIASLIPALVVLCILISKE